MSLKSQCDLVIVFKPGERKSSADIHFQNSDLQNFLMVFINPSETTYFNPVNKTLISLSLCCRLKFHSFQKCVVESADWLHLTLRKASDLEIIQVITAYYL